MGVHEVRAGVLVIAVGIARADARAALDDDGVAAAYQLVSGRGQKADAEFLGFDFFGDADGHGQARREAGAEFGCRHVTDATRSNLEETDAGTLADAPLQFAAAAEIGARNTVFRRDDQRAAQRLAGFSHAALAELADTEAAPGGEMIGIQQDDFAAGTLGLSQMAEFPVNRRAASQPGA